MTLNLTILEPFRLRKVEHQILERCKQVNQPGEVRAGDVLCLQSGRTLRWSIHLPEQGDPYLPELFLSARDPIEHAATDLEAQFALTRLGLKATRELNAETAAQNTIRAFHVEPKP